MSQIFRRAPVLLDRRTDIGLILRSDREAMGKTCLDLDFEIGVEDGYIQKCENGGRVSAKQNHTRYPIRISEIGFCWMQYCGRSLVMMDTTDALRIGEVFPVEAVGHRYERVRCYAPF